MDDYLRGKDLDEYHYTLLISFTIQLERKLKRPIDNYEVDEHVKYIRKYVGFYRWFLGEKEIDVDRMILPRLLIEYYELFK